MLAYTSYHVVARGATFSEANIQVDTERTVDLSHFPCRADVDPCHRLDLGSRKGEEGLLTVRFLRFQELWRCSDTSSRSKQSTLSFPKK